MTIQTKRLTVYNSFIHPDAAQRVAECLHSGVISEAALVQQFEGLLAQRGLVSPIALNSGSTALQLALMLADVGAGDEVICPAQTFVATALAVLMQKATPVFCDVDYLTGNIDCNDLENRITARTKAVMPVHWAGYPCEMDKINAIAKRHGISVVEDAAHAFGAKYKGQPIGSLSDYSCFSFQAIKHVTTGDGGAICCLDPATTERARISRWFGIDRSHSPISPLGERIYNIEELGFKFHMNDYSAALGIANLQGFEERLQHRNEVASYYRSELSSVPGITLFRQDAEHESANWLFPVHVEKRDHFIEAMKNANVGVSVVHQRIDRNAIFGGMRNDLPNQDRFEISQIHIPVHDAITMEDAHYIVSSIKKGW